ncbi:MAG: DUF4326 domain-containing protein [Defluviicoccus sp.]|nr:DUF4326 domain-containing protein [Defluviicoccus sp.]
MARIVNMKHEPDAVARGAVRIDRRTPWGNPFVVGKDGTRDEVIARYRAHLWRRIRSGEIALADLAALESRDLACWCWPSRCHGTVLARAAAWAAAELRARAASTEPILFWSRCPQWGWLSNFAAAGFAGPGGALWPTVEHWYQAGKTLDPASAERIRLAATPRAALRLGRGAPCRADWDDAKLPRMASGLLLRFAPQRPDTARLLATGERALRHATPWGAHGDPFWGIGRDGAGANRLGRMLEGIRAARRGGAPLDAAALAARVR